MPTRAPRRDATENRSALVDAARAALLSDPDASLETIAGVAGLSRRAVYGHFASRDALVEEVVTAGAHRVVGALPTPDDLVGLAPAAGIAVVAAALWAEVEHVRALAQIAVRGPFSDRIAEAFAPVRAQVLDAVRRGITDGAFRDDVDAPTLARLVEGACFAVLDEATRSDTDRATGRSMVVLSALGMAGVGWTDARHVLEVTPVAATLAPASPPATPPDPERIA